MARKKASVGTDLVLKGGPSTKASLEKKRHIQQLFVDAMWEGDGDPMSVVKKLANGDRKKYKRWRQRWQRWLNEPEFQEMIGVAAKGEKVSHLISASKALGRRADKGNVPAIKLLFEAVGYWSPRTTMEHTGEVQVVLKGGYRPKPVEDDIEIEEADVVEDTED
jgi:hypothetical protein